MLVERLSPRWSSTGLTPFLGRPGHLIVPNKSRPPHAGGALPGWS
ncbi:hypothetical protein AVEN_177872-1, partial [Araneus ventricosus]